MKQLTVIQTIGSIIKQELLNSLNDNILPNTCVLFSRKLDSERFTERDQIQLEGEQLSSIYIVLQYRYAPEKILKLSKQISKLLNTECSITYVEIMLKDKILPCIRIKRLRHMSYVSTIQKIIKTNNFKLSQTPIIIDNCFVKIFKNFKVLEIDPYIYRDYFEREKIYIKPPYGIDNDLFNLLVFRVKEKMVNNNFDAALGELYRFNGTETIIRILDKNRSLERALEFKMYFMKELDSEIINGKQTYP